MLPAERVHRLHKHIAHVHRIQKNKASGAHTGADGLSSGGLQGGKGVGEVWGAEAGGEDTATTGGDMFAGRRTAGRFDRAGVLRELTEDICSANQSVYTIL